MKKVKTFLLLSALLLSSQLCSAGEHERAAKRARQYRPRYGLWFHPNRASVIDGLAIGPFNFQSWRQDSMLTVNGINLEIPGVGLFPLPVQGNYITVNGLDLTPFRYGGSYRGLSAIMSSAYSVQGCSIGLFTGADKGMSGLQLAGMVAHSGQMNGVQVGCFNFTKNGKGILLGGYTCLADSMNGVSFSVCNSSKHFHKGLQIGLINYTQRLKGVQIGLLNIAPNCKRKWTPFVQISRREKS